MYLHCIVCFIWEIRTVTCTFASTQAISYTYIRQVTYICHTCIHSSQHKLCYTHTYFVSTQVTYVCHTCTSSQQVISYIHVHTSHTHTFLPILCHFATQLSLGLINATILEQKTEHKGKAQHANSAHSGSVRQGTIHTAILTLSLSHNSWHI